MNYPECPTRREDCKFQDLGSSVTAMYSPIQFDRNNKAVGGGANRHTRAVQCTVCQTTWTESRTELETMQGVKPIWEIVK